MNETKSALPAKIGGTEITRFNALRHGVLSRYTVLPWESADEYRQPFGGDAQGHDREGGAGALAVKRSARISECDWH